MTALARTPAAFEVRSFDGSADRQSDARLRLLPAGDGWSLVGPGGELVFHSLGTRGRRRCLEFARSHGVLAVFS